MSAPSCSVILTYHSISADPPPLAVSPALFAEQMEWLKANASVMPLDAIVDGLRERRALPEHVVALTFDDGYQDFASSAFPVLRRLQLPATVFLPTGHCGKTNAWPGQPDWVQQQPLLNWEEICELAAAGIEFGSHSVTHPRLDRISAEGLERELAGSKDEIAKRTGREARFFCYPYGEWSPLVRDAVRRHYGAACSTGLGRVNWDADPYVLPRVDAHYVRNPAWFRSLFGASTGAYLALRRLIRRLRGQPEGYVSRVGFGDHPQH